MTAPPPSSPIRARNRQAMRDAVLDAAERLLARGTEADFSMRDLAAEAGVGFATPFNHFGSKSAIMQSLSARVIGRMAAQFRARPPAGDAIDRTLAMARIAAMALLEQPAVYKAVIGSLSVAPESSPAVQENSRGLWALALGDLAGIAAPLRPHAAAILAAQIAYGFRGCLSFWIAGEIANERLIAAVETNVATLLLGFATPSRRPFVLHHMPCSDGPPR